MHNKEFLDNGTIRVSPASTYSDGALTKGQQASELEIDTLSPRHIFATEDYYTICLSSVYRYRMHYEFGADSCVAINDIKKFRSLINSAISDFNNNSTDFKLGSAAYCPIYYYDPVYTEDPVSVEEIFFTKPFRYAYQHEFRVVILPTHPQELKPFFLKLGSLADIAELICES